MKPACFLIVGMMVTSLALFAASNGAWMAKVPALDHERSNPYRDNPEALTAGQHIYHEYCARCHGLDAQGTRARPSLRSERVQQQATEGDLYWLVTNGSMSDGMPPWAQLGDQPIWQVITYLRSLHVEPAAR